MGPYINDASVAARRWDTRTAPRAGVRTWPARAAYGSLRCQLPIKPTPLPPSPRRPGAAVSAWCGSPARLCRRWHAWYHASLCGACCLREHDDQRLCRIGPLTPSKACRRRVLRLAIDTRNQERHARRRPDIIFRTRVRMDVQDRPPIQGQSTFSAARRVPYSRRSLLLFSTPKRPLSEFEPSPPPVM